MKLIVFLLVFGYTAANYTSESCLEIEDTFRSVVDTGEEPVCRCMPKAFGSDENEAFIFIGCTRQNMPSVFRALRAPNETNITQLWIWDSLINIIPSEMFSRVRPKILSIENSMVSLFRPGAFANIGNRLKSLFLKNNIVKRVNNETFTDLKVLEILDLSGNKLNSIQRGHFNQLNKLEILQLGSNQINDIEDFSFSKLSNLKNLVLAQNQLTKITKNTFHGLDNLEVLHLEGNNLSNVDWIAFKHMKKLRVLDLGNNSLQEIDLRGLPRLESVFINNNKIQNMHKVMLDDLPQLRTLNLDKNRIAQISTGDMDGLNQSPKLNSLSLVGNNMTHIDAAAFEKCSQLTVLSLQNNNLTSLSSVPKGGYDAVSWLKPLKNLTSLFLTWNQIAVLRNGELNVIPSLQEVAMDHNKLGTIDKDALTGLQLRNLFLNGNELYYLPEGLFQGWNTDVIYSVDLAENPWECICGHEWIGEWLRDLGERSTPSGNVGCLYNCGKKAEETPKHSAWITVVAGILAFVALLFLAAIAYLYIQETCSRSPMPLKRIPSDMVRLIPSMESLSFPNPVAGDPSKEDGTDVKISKKSSPTSSSTGENQDDSKAEKKRVRFNGI